MVLIPSSQRVLALANQLLEAGDLAGAERALSPLIGASADAQLLGAMGTVRLRQNQLREAESLFARASASAPKEPMHAINLGRARAALGQVENAIAGYRAAIKLNPNLASAYFELAALQQRSGRLEDAETTYRKLLRVMPDNAQAKLMLGWVLMEAGKPADAETLLRRALSLAPDDKTLDHKTRASLRNGVAWAMRRQNRHEEALTEFDAVRALDPAMPYVEIQRAEIMQDLRRYDEALGIFLTAITREPLNPHLHRAYNDLLYRLGRKDEFLASYDRVTKSRELMLDKAAFLTQDKRPAEAYDVYRDILARSPSDTTAAMGAAGMLSLLGRHAEASRVFDAVLAQHGDNVDVCNHAAEAALLGGDPHKSLTLYQRSLRQSRYNQASLAGLSAALRLMGDERDESLNGYDSLIQLFDLEPPEGFSNMAEFNAELNAYLDSLHPQTREYISQSLRGGTQTPAQLFGAGHDLVQRLQACISEAVARYIASLKQDANHPFLSRRARDFRYVGSWSSRLRDCGFHINHIHPTGWISSCYYVGVPEAVKDETTRQGWIKFGEPSFAVTLENPIRRAVQPVPGRLVLFPSFIWHGTIPFHDAQPRTTIAFDVVPVA
jgi:tetratricopeptide (TPR) repeat protein